MKATNAICRDLISSPAPRTASACSTSLMMSRTTKLRNTLMICRMSKARARTRASKIPSLGWNGVDGSHLLVLGDHESLRKALGIRSETLALALLARVHHITATLAKCAKNLSAPVAACAKAVRIMATLRSLTRCSAVAVARPLILACAQLLQHFDAQCRTSTNKNTKRTIRWESVSDLPKKHKPKRTRDQAATIPLALFVTCCEENFTKLSPQPVNSTSKAHRSLLQDSNDDPTQGPPLSGRLT